MTIIVCRTPVWSSYLVSDIRLLKNYQKRFIRIPFREIHCGSYQFEIKPGKLFLKNVLCRKYWRKMFSSINEHQQKISLNARAFLCNISVISERPFAESWHQTLREAKYEMRWLANEKRYFVWEKTLEKRRVKNCCMKLKYAHCFCAVKTRFLKKNVLKKWLPQKDFHLSKKL